MADNPQLFIEDRLLDTISKNIREMQKGMEKLQKLNKNMDTLEDDEFVAWLTNPSTDLTTQLDLALQFKDFMKMFGPQSAQFLKCAEEIQKEVELSKRHISFFNSAMKTMTSSMINPAENVKIKMYPVVKKHETPISKERHLPTSGLQSSSSQRASFIPELALSTISKAIKPETSMSRIENVPIRGLQYSSSQRALHIQPAEKDSKTISSDSENSGIQRRMMESYSVQEFEIPNNNITTTSQSTSKENSKPIAKIVSEEDHGRIQKIKQSGRCFLCSKKHHPTQFCLKYPTLVSRIAYISKRRLCGNCLKHRINGQPCRNPPVICHYCRGNHSLVVCDKMPDSYWEDMPKFNEAFGRDSSNPQKD